MLALTTAVFFLYHLRPVVVSTTSMKPSLSPGDLVVTFRSGPEYIQVGDIIVYRKVIPFSRADTVVHRVVEV